MVRRSVVDLVAVVVDPLGVPQGVDERAAVAIREHDLARERGAVGVLHQGVQHLVHIVGEHHVVIVHEGDILALRLVEQHVPLLPDAHLPVVGEVQHLDIPLAHLPVEFRTESRKALLAILKGRDQDRQLMRWSPHGRSPPA